MSEPASPDQALLRRLGERLARARLDLNRTQAALAREAGVSKSTVERLENGESTQLSNFLRILRVLGLVDFLSNLLIEPPPSPIELLKLQGNRRQRASRKGRKPRGASKSKSWTWDDES
ncbi:MAG: helix-turn-helix transcriptional regulator [Planctomycetes bacterium]|nr:helix-turn-helix transcriptional regulator [Planctomycetota bacterium]